MDMWVQKRVVVKKRKEADHSIAENSMFETKVDKVEYNIFYLRIC